MRRMEESSFRADLNESPCNCSEFRHVNASDQTLGRAPITHMAKILLDTPYLVRE